MKKKLNPVLLLAFCMATPLFIAQAGDEPGAKIKNAIRHRCVISGQHSGFAGFGHISLLRLRDT